MLKRLINLPFSVAGRAARAFQDREDARTREKYGAFQDPGDVPVSSGPAVAPEMAGAQDSFRMDVAAARAARRVCFVDVRPSAAGGIAGALHMPLGEVGVRVSELPPDQLVVVYCDSGADSARAVTFFRERGMEDTWWLSGGLAAWKAAAG